jgi:hypothetical protein
MTMRFIPTHCEVCSTPALVSSSEIHAGLARCIQCGGSATVLPGESYAEHDAALFSSIVATLREADITPPQAALLATELEARSLLVPGRCLRRLAQALPSLGVLELLVGNERAALRKAEGMLATLLDVMSRARHSEIVPAIVHARSKASGH